MYYAIKMVYNLKPVFAHIIWPNPEKYEEQELYPFDREVFKRSPKRLGTGFSVALLASSKSSAFDLY